MGSILNLTKLVWRYLKFDAPKTSLFKQNLESTYISEMTPKRRFLKGFFATFWE